MISQEIRFLLTHSSIYGLGTVVSQIVSFLLLPLYTRYLTPEDYGVLQTVEITDKIIGIVVTIGIARALSRFFYESDAESERNSVVSTAYGSYCLSAVIALPCFFLVSDHLSRLLLDSVRFSGFFRIAFLSMVFGGMTDIGMMYLRLKKKPTIFVSITLSRLVLLVVLNIVFLVKMNMGIEGMLYSSLISNALYSAMLSTAILWRTKFRFDTGIARQLLRYSLPMVPTSFGNIAVKQADKYFILYYMSVADMGIYSLALKIGNAIHTLLTVPFNMAYIPRRFEIMKREDASQIYARIFTYYVFFIGFAGLTLSMLIPEILRFLVTPKFYGASNIIPLVVVSMIIFGTQFHFDFGILYAKKTKYLTYISFSAAIVQIALNFVLIKRYGFFGAVWSSIISLGIQALLLYILSRRFYPVCYEFRRILVFTVIALLSYYGSTLVRSDLVLLNLAIKCVILLIFPLLLVITRVITPSEMTRIKSIYLEKVKPRITGIVTAKTTP